MAVLGRLIAFLALTVLVLPYSAAQDAEKKDADKKAIAKADEKKADDKKGDEKKDPEKKDEKKGADAKDKKDDEKPTKKKDGKTKEPEEKVVYGQTITARISRMDANSAREFAIAMPQIDPQKVIAFNQWKMVRLTQLRTPADYATFQREIMQKQANELHTMKDFEIRAAEGCKVRSMFPPQEFDLKGNLKRWTQKELTALRGKTTLPGYPADFDRLRENQTVTIYLAKVDQPKGASGTKGKKNGLDDLGPKKKNNLTEDELDRPRPEAVMIVVIQEAPVRRD